MASYCRHAILMFAALMEKITCIVSLEKIRFRRDNREEEDNIWTEFVLCSLKTNDFCILPTEPEEFRYMWARYMKEEDRSLARNYSL